MHRALLRPLGLCLLLVGGCDSGVTGPGDPPGNVVPGICQPSNTVALEVEEAARFQGGAAGFFCVEAGPGNEEYVMVTSLGSTAAASLTVLGENVTPAVGPPNPSSIRPELALFGGSGPADAPLAPDHRFHIELREREERELGPRVRTGTGPAAPLRSLAGAQPAAVPTVGQLLTFNAASQNACNTALNVTGRVQAVSNRAVVVADTANPSGGFTASEYQHYAATFDTLIGPLADQNFGPATDIDGNGRTILLFTQEVNRLTPTGSASFTGGFFFSRDLFPKQASGHLSACATSNEAEILYLMVPDPNGEVNGNKRSKGFLQQITPATMIHELQHLINAGRRLHVHKLSGQTWNEEVWLNEALSHAGEELLFYHVSGLGPGMNISPSLLQTTGNHAVNALNQHQAFNLARFHAFLERPEENAPFRQQDVLATRGASWSFLRYIADRRAGSQTQLFLDLVNSTSRGIPNLSGKIGGTETFFEWLADWSVAIYADDRVPGLADRHRTRSWNFPALHGSLSDGKPYPIRTLSLTAGSARTQELTGGGTAYFRFGLASGDTGSLELTSGSSGPPQGLTATVVRTR